MRPQGGPLALALGALGLCNTVDAQPRWEEALRPGRHGGRVLADLASGDALLSSFGGAPLGARNQARQSAEARFRQALALDPENPEALAGVADLEERDGHHGAAAALARRSLELDPVGPHAPDAWFTLSLAHTRQRRFDLARDDYLRLLTFHAGEHYRALVWGNLADTYISLHALGPAIEAYEACVAANPQYALGWLGLAVSYDRDAREDATVAAERALREASDEEARAGAHGHVPAQGVVETAALVRALNSPNVFFEPPYDRHYYDGVAQEALARAHGPGGVAPPDTARAQRAREAASQSWAAFLRDAPQDDPWRPRVQAHLRRLGRVAPRPARGRGP
ncbi:MAG: tetratricopeptide repeat protein [Deltaproteobacteria bacterium]|nr:tetratricopeptide repeat protein [Deltaproteobacteria bacterium]